MLDNEVISEVLFRMTGEIHPIQETNYDDKAYLNNEVETQGYKIETIGDTLIAPLSLYSKKVSSVDELKELAGPKGE